MELPDCFGSPNVTFLMTFDVTSFSATYKTIEDR